MSNFKIGEKIVCIDDSGFGKHSAINYNGAWIKLNEMYTVRGFLDLGNDFALYLEEHSFGIYNEETNSYAGIEAAYRPDRFRKVVYEFADEVIEMLKEETVVI